MGRKSIPDQKKALQGTLKKCRTKEKSETNAGVCKPVTKTTPPAWLSVEARKIYAATAKMLISWKVLTKLDLPLLAAYAAAYANLLKSYADVEKIGYFFEEVGKNGSTTKIHPSARMFKDSLDTINKIGAQFGLSPVSRRSLDSVTTKSDDKTKENDPFANYC